MTNENEQTIELTRVPKRQRIDQETFLTTWETVRTDGGTIGDVANALKANKANVQSRACQLRKAGVPLLPLKRMTGGGTPKITLQDSLALLAKIRGVSLEEITAESEAMLATRNAE